MRAIDWNVTARMNHPFIKKFVEERELTLMLRRGPQRLGLFGSREQSKRELAAEIASVLAFSAIRNNDKVGLILFTDEVEKFIPPRKGRRHVLRVIREILFFEPQRRGHGSEPARWNSCCGVTPHRAIAVVLSDFLGNRPPAGAAGGQLRPQLMLLESLAQASSRCCARPTAGTTSWPCRSPTASNWNCRPSAGWCSRTPRPARWWKSTPAMRANAAAFAERQARAQAELARLFRSAGIDAIQLRTDQPYAIALGRFFETREKRRLRG